MPEERGTYLRGNMDIYVRGVRDIEAAHMTYDILGQWDIRLEMQIYSYSFTKPKPSMEYG